MTLRINLHLSNSVTEPDLLATAVPAASVSIPAPTSTTANASSGTVPSNIPTTATSAAAAAMSTETALPVAVTRPPPNPRSLEDISQLLVQMQELVSRTQAPMQVIGPGCIGADGSPVRACYRLSFMCVSMH